MKSEGDFLMAPHEPNPIEVEIESRIQAIKPDELLALDGRAVPGGIYRVETVRRLVPLSLRPGE
jgi:hypothetical protein